MWRNKNMLNKNSLTSTYDGAEYIILTYKKLHKIKKTCMLSKYLKTDALKNTNKIGVTIVAA